MSSPVTSAVVGSVEVIDTEKEINMRFGDTQLAYPRATS